jgi:hypothetical protein
MPFSLFGTVNIVSFHTSLSDARAWKPNWGFASFSFNDSLFLEGWRRRGFSGRSAFSIRRTSDDMDEIQRELNVGGKLEILISAAAPKSLP